MRVEHIGLATLYLSDCREILPNEPLDVVLTDPPYGISYESGHATDKLWKAGRKITNDADCAVRDEALGMLDCPMLVFGTAKRPPPPRTRMTLIWDKGEALGMGALDLPWKPTVEEIHVIGKGFIGGRNWGSVIYHHPTQSTAKNGRLHPNEKPVGLLGRLLRWLPAGTVCDPFMGSGSTGEAALAAHRPFVGIEIEQKYFDVACRRLEAVTRQLEMFAPLESN